MAEREMSTVLNNAVAKAAELTPAHRAAMILERCWSETPVGFRGLDVEIAEQITAAVSAASKAQARSITALVNAARMTARTEDPALLASPLLTDLWDALTAFESAS